MTIGLVLLWIVASALLSLLFSILTYSLRDFTRARDIIRWCLGKALGSNSATGSASSHRRQPLSISIPRWLKVSLLRLFQRSTFHVRWCAAAAHD